MWIRAYDGKLVNCDHIQELEDRRLDTAEPPGERSLVARYASGVGEVILARGEAAAGGFEAVRLGLANAKSFVDLRPPGARPATPGVPAPPA